MDIIKRVFSAVGEIVPTFSDIPEFTADSEPDRYIILNISHNGAEFGDGTHHSYSFLISLNVYSPMLDFALYEQVIGAMEAAGFSFAGGGNVGNDAEFPYTAHYYLDFLGVDAREPK